VPEPNIVEVALQEGRPVAYAFVRKPPVLVASAVRAAIPVGEPKRRLPSATEATPVPPPTTERVPLTVGVNISAPLVGTIVWPKVSPLKERVVVLKAMVVPVVEAYPEPSAVMPLAGVEVATQPIAPLVYPRT
jgi:hypothetical protein